MGFSEMPSRCALLAIDPFGLSIFRLMTPVGVLAFAIGGVRLRRLSGLR